MPTAVLNQPLNGFALPDTSSPVEGVVPAGAYGVLDRKQNHPTTDTDYARIGMPTLSGGDTWICTRWKTTIYAKVSDQPPHASFEDDPTAIDEQHLRSLLADFVPFTYGAGRYPWPLPGVKVPLQPPAQNNCCTFVEGLVVKAWSNARGPGFAWSAHRHEQMMVTTMADPYSPVTALIEEGLAIPVPNPDTPPHPWTVIQGWDGSFTTGHTFIVVDHDPVTDRVLTIESNKFFGLMGVGWRNIGMLKDHPTPGTWWTNTAVPRWSQLRSRYKHRRQAWLRVRQAVLSGRM